MKLGLGVRATTTVLMQMPNMKVYEIKEFKVDDNTKVVDISDRISEFINDLSTHSLVFFDEDQDFPVQPSQGIVDLLGGPNDVVSNSNPYPFSKELQFKLIESTYVNIEVKYDDSLDSRYFERSFSLIHVPCDTAIKDLIYNSDNSDLTSAVTGEFKVVSFTVSATGARKKYNSDPESDSIVKALSGIKDEYGLIRRGAVNIKVLVTSAVADISS